MPKAIQLIEPGQRKSMKQWFSNQVLLQKELEESTTTLHLGDCPRTILLKMMLTGSAKTHASGTTTKATKKLRLMKCVTAICPCLNVKLETGAMEMTVTEY